MLNEILSFLGDWVFVALTFALGYALGAAAHSGPQEIHHWHLIDQQPVQQTPWIMPPRQEKSSHEC